MEEQVQAIENSFNNVLQTALISYERSNGDAFEASVKHFCASCSSFRAGLDAKRSHLSVPTPAPARTLPPAVASIALELEAKLGEMRKMPAGA